MHALKGGRLTRGLRHILPLWGLLKLEYHIQRRYTAANLMGLVHSVTVLLFFYFLAGVIEKPAVLKTAYFPFVAIGIVVTRVYQGLCQGGPARIEEWKKLRVLDALFVTGDRSKVLLFAGLPSLVLCLGEALLLLGVGLVLSEESFSVSIVWAGVAGVLLLWLAVVMAFLSALSVLRWRRLNVVASLGSLSALFLSGAYFPVDLLPEPVARFAAVLPLTLVLDCFRGALLGTTYVTSSTGTALAGVILWCVGLSFLSIFAFRAVDNRGRSTGSHAQL